jgi:LysM repeat protein
MKNKTTIIIILFIFAVVMPVTAQEQGRIFKDDEQLTYTIKPGDTFYDISSKLDISVNILKSLNQQLDPTNLQIGTKIRVKFSPKVKLHIVQSGDTLWGISKSYPISFVSLLRANLIDNSELIFPGEIIIIPSQIKTKLYFIKFTSKDAFLISETRRISGTGNLYVNAVKELIKGPTTDEKAFMPIPKEIKVLGVEVKNGIAHVNFGPKIRRSNVGSASEFLLLAAIANTLTEFDKVNQVKILENGKSIETIGGHIVLDQPLNRSMNIVKKQYRNKIN